VKPDLVDFDTLDIIPQVKPWLGEDEREAVAGVVASGWITEGPQAEAFGAELNAMMGARFGVFAPNGTLALSLGLMALGIGPGDEVLIPDTTFAGSATAVLMVGATPVFVEVDRLDFQIDIADAQRAVTPRTRAVMPVHLYGGMCDMTALGAFAARNGLLVVEDAAQAIGVRQDGRDAGTFGDVGCFSFFADKTITTGEGGYVVCRDADVHSKLLHLRNQGRLDWGSFIHDEIGYSMRITEMQSTIGRVQLRKLDAIVAAKRAHHTAFCSAFDGLETVRVMSGAPGSSFVPFRCVLMAERAHELMAWLEARKIKARTVFAPLHRQPCFAELHLGAPSDQRFLNSIYAFEHGVCLPVFPELTLEQIARIVRTIVEFHR